MQSKIRTRVLIISDTHGMDLMSNNSLPPQRADVAIHCGDLTDESKLCEFQTTLAVLRAIDAPLKLVIAGNHDFTMDTAAFSQKVCEATPPLDPALVRREYGHPGQARAMFEDATARADGVVFLDEGTHSFVLGNGALLTVYASPYTPALGAWGFQYLPEKGHRFDIGSEVDIAVTHGPPRGVMDYTAGRERAGCADLFAAVAAARPCVHCFGHIHEGWGAKLVTWRDSCARTYGSDLGNEHGAIQRPTHFTAIDNDRSHVITKLTSFVPNKFDSQDEINRKQGLVEKTDRQKCCMTSHCAGDEYPIEKGKQTLFVNAAFAGSGERPVQWPWVVDVELAKASE